MSEANQPGEAGRGDMGTGTAQPSSTPRVGVAQARRVARNTLLQVVADAVSKLAMLVLFAVMARELGDVQFGQFTFGLSVVVFIEFVSVGVDVAIAHGVARDRTGARQLLWNSLLLKAVTGLVGAVIVLGIASVSEHDPQVRLMLVVIAIAKLVEMAAYSFYATFRGLEDARPVAISYIIQRFSMAAVGIAGLLAFGFDVVDVALAYLGSSFLALLYASSRLSARVRSLWHPRSSAAGARALLKASLPIGIGSIFGAFLARIDAVILTLLSTAAVVGQYGVAYRLFEGSLFVSYAFGIAVLPVLSRLGRTSSPPASEVLEIAAKAICLLLFPLGVGIALFADPLVSGIFGSDYGAAIEPTRILGGAVALFGVYVLGIYGLVSQDSQRPLPWVMASLAAINVGLNFALIPEMSASGAATAMTTTQALGAVIMFGLAARTVGGISISRAFLGPVAGCAAMAGGALAVGETAEGLIVSVIAFIVVAGVIELSAYPQDMRLGLRAMRARGIGGQPSESIEPAPVE